MTPSKRSSSQMHNEPSYLSTSLDPIIAIGFMRKPRPSQTPALLVIESDIRHRKISEISFQLSEIRMEVLSGHEQNQPLSTLLPTG